MSPCFPRRSLRCVCRQGLGLPARKCLDNQAEDHRDASFLCLLVHRCPCTSLSAQSFVLQLWPSGVPVRDRMPGGEPHRPLLLGTMGGGWVMAAFVVTERSVGPQPGSVQRQLRACSRPVGRAGGSRGWRAPACTLLSKSTRERQRPPQRETEHAHLSGALAHFSTECAGAGLE